MHKRKWLCPAILPSPEHAFQETHPCHFHNYTFDKIVRCVFEFDICFLDSNKKNQTVLLFPFLESICRPVLQRLDIAPFPAIFRIAVLNSGVVDGLVMDALFDRIWFRSVVCVNVRLCRMIRNGTKAFFRLLYSFVPQLCSTKDRWKQWVVSVWHDVFKIACNCDEFYVMHVWYLITVVLISGPFFRTFESGFLSCSLGLLWVQV